MTGWLETITACLPASGQLGYALLIIGLVGDVAVLLVPTRWITIEKAASVVFTLLVIAGVAIEHNADVLAKASRVLSAQQLKSAAEKFAPFKGAGVVCVGASPVTFESESLAVQLRLVFEADEFGQCAGKDEVISYRLGLVRGVVVVFTSGNSKGERFAKAVAEILDKDGISAVPIGRTDPGLAKYLQQSGKSVNDDAFSGITIGVGDKP